MPAEVEEAIVDADLPLRPAARPRSRRAACSVSVRGSSYGVARFGRGWRSPAALFAGAASTWRTHASSRPSRSPATTSTRGADVGPEQPEERVLALAADGSGSACPTLCASAALSHSVPVDAEPARLRRRRPSRRAPRSRRNRRPGRDRRARVEIEECRIQRGGSRPRIASMTRNKPRSFGENCASTTSGPVSAAEANAAASMRAAPCTSRSMRPKRSIAASTAADTCAASFRSAARTSDFVALVRASEPAGAAVRAARSASQDPRSAACPLVGIGKRGAAEQDQPRAEPVEHPLGEVDAHVAQAAGDHHDRALRQVRRRRGQPNRSAAARTSRRSACPTRSATAARAPRPPARRRSGRRRRASRIDVEVREAQSGVLLRQHLRRRRAPSARGGSIASSSCTRHGPRATSSIGSGRTVGWPLSACASRIGASSVTSAASSRSVSPGGAALQQSIDAGQARLRPRTRRRRVARSASGSRRIDRVGVVVWRVEADRRADDERLRTRGAQLRDDRRSEARLLVEDQHPAVRRAASRRRAGSGASRHTGR